MVSLKIARFAAVLGAALVSGTALHAENCAPSNTAVSGTLASPSKPCPATPQAKKPTVVRTAPKERGTKAPGVYRQGNTTVHIGGSVSTDVNVRGR